jgi:hypothetical protein
MEEPKRYAHWQIYRGKLIGRWRVPRPMPKGMDEVLWKPHKAPATSVPRGRINQTVGKLIDFSEKTRETTATKAHSAETGQGISEHVRQLTRLLMTKWNNCRVNNL